MAASLRSGRADLRRRNFRSRPLPFLADEREDQGKFLGLCTSILWSFVPLAHRGHVMATSMVALIVNEVIPFLKTVDEYDFTFQSGVRLSLLGSALSADFITQGQSLVFSGPSGTGKTHLAIASPTARSRTASTPSSRKPSSARMTSRRLRAARGPPHPSWAGGAGRQTR